MVESARGPLWGTNVSPKHGATARFRGPETGTCASVRVGRSFWGPTFLQNTTLQRDFGTLKQGCAFLCIMGTFWTSKFHNQVSPDARCKSAQQCGRTDAHTHRKSYQVRIRGSPLAAFRSLSDHSISKGAITHKVCKLQMLPRLEL